MQSLDIIGSFREIGLISCRLLMHQRAKGFVYKDCRHFNSMADFDRFFFFKHRNRVDLEKKRFSLHLFNSLWISSVYSSI